MNSIPTCTSGPHALLDYLSISVSIFSMAFIMLTMLLRGNDYRRKLEVLSHVAVIRILGFILTGFTPIGVVGWWLITGAWPSIFTASFLFGVSMIFFTSENVPPWWLLLTKGNIALTNRRSTDVRSS